MLISEMTLTIHLPPEQEKKLSERTAASGKPVEQYIQSLIQKDIEQAPFAELFAPVHQAVRESGVSDEELDGMLQGTLAETRASRRQNP